MFGLLILLSILVSAWGASKLTFVDNLEAAFRSDASAFQQYEALKQDFALGENDLFVLIESQQPVGRDILEALAEFTLDAQLTEGVGGVVSILSLRVPDVGGEDLRPVIPLNESTEELSAETFQSALVHPLNLNGALLSDDLRRLSVRILISENGPGDQDLSDFISITDSLQTSFDQSVGTQPVKSSWSGVPLLRLDVIDRLVRDQFTLNLAGSVLGFIGSCLLLGSWRLAVLTSIPPMIAMIWLLGFMGHAALSFNVITNVLPVLVLVIGFADSMHLTFSWRRQAQLPSVNRNTAIERSVDEVGLACVMTTVTTAIAFLSLLINDSALIRGFGVSGVLAVFLTLAAVLITHPLVFALAIRFGFIRDRDLSAKRVTRLLDGAVSIITGIVFRYAKAVATTGIALTLLALWFYFPLDPRYSFLENVPDDAPIAQSIAAMDAAQGGTHSLDVIIPFDLSSDDTLSQSLEKLRRTHKTLEQTVSPQPVYSAWSIANTLGDPLPQNWRSHLREELLNDERDESNRFISKSRAEARIQVLVPDRGVEQTRVLAASVSEALSTLNQDHFMSGILLVSAVISDQMIKQLNWSILGTGILSAFVLAAVFRQPRYVGYAIVPNILPIVLTGAFLNIFGYGLQFSGALAMTIALGIAVDDTIHMLNRMRQCEKAGGSGIPAVSALADVGPVLVATSVILVLGIAATGFSDMPSISNFGLLSAMVIVLALLADLFVLPAIVLAFRRRWIPDNQRIGKIRP